MSHFTADLLFFAALVCALIAQGMVIRSIAATPARVSGPGGTVVHRSREMMWTVLTAVALLVTFAMVWAARHEGPERHDLRADTSARVAVDRTRQ